MKKVVALLISIIFALHGCGGGSDSMQTNTQRYQPTLDDIWQYQLTDDINLSTNATLYDIDMEDTSQKTIELLHTKGLKVICYFSAGSSENWRSDFNSFKPEDMGKNLAQWNGERWLDITSENVHSIMQTRLDRAKAKGCDGVEVDNVNGYTNDTGFDFNATQQLEYNRFLAREAHKRGLSIGLKNDLLQVKELVDDFDFAINEQCFAHNECHYLEPFIEHKKPVFNVEYDTHYLASDAMTQLCNASKAKQFSTNILPLHLDGTFRYNCDDYLFHIRGVGFGSADAFKFHNNEYINVYDLINTQYDSYKNSVTDFNESAFVELSSYLQHTKYMVFWMTQEWQERWFDMEKIQKLMDQGKIPVFLYWYFGDHLQENGYLQNNKEDYLQDIQRVGKFIKQLKGDKFLILEPEFNKNNILQNDTDIFIDVMRHAIDELRTIDKNIFLSLAMMDTGSRTALSDLGKCGYSSCALGDISEWQRVERIYDALLEKIDFIAFEEMVAQFSRDPQNPGTWNAPNPKSYSDQEIGITYLAQRIENLAEYLKKRYNKPLFMPYIAIATATWSDNNGNNVVESDEINSSGWEMEAHKVYSELNVTALFGYGVMELFDNPTHDSGGYQFFMENEYHLGIVKAPVKETQLTGAIEFKSDIISTIFK